MSGWDMITLSSSLTQHYCLHTLQLNATKVLSFKITHLDSCLICQSLDIPERKKL